MASVPPSATQAEASLLSTLFLAGRTMAGEIFDSVQAEDFYGPINRRVYESARKVYRAGSEIDVVLVSEDLATNWQANEPPAMFLARLLDGQPVATNIEQYCRLVKDAAVRRRLIVICNTMAQRCYAESDAQDILSAAQTGIMGLTMESSQSDYHRIEELLDTAMDRYEALASNADTLTGIPTGFERLDFLTCGWQRTDSIYIAARPSMGKTALMCSMICNNLLDRRSVGVFSLEMSRDQITDRILAAVSDINLMRLRSGKFRDGDMERIVTSAGDLSSRSLAVDDTGGISIEEISRKAKLMVAKDKIEVLYLDYLGLIQPPKTARSVVEGLSIITRRLKLLAKELNIPVVSLCQLNRKLEERTNKRPILSDLRDSGSIEQDADVVVFIYRDEVYDAQTKKPGVAEILVSKQRSGPTGMIELAWVPSVARFDNMP